MTDAPIFDSDAWRLTDQERQLTTQAREWFLDKGFVDASIEDLPAQKQELYNWQRQSKILAKTLP